MTLRNNACAGCIHLHYELSFRIGMVQDWSGSKSFLESLEGRTGCWRQPVRLESSEALTTFLSHRSHWSCYCAEVVN